MTEKITTIDDLKKDQKEQLFVALRKMGKKHVNSPYRSDWDYDNPAGGYCYVISEVLINYSLFGLAPEGSKSYCIVDKPFIGEDSSHWFIRNLQGDIVDLTISKNDKQHKYSKGKKKSFMKGTQKISKRGRMLAYLLGLTDTVDEDIRKDIDRIEKNAP
jgi:hypothetical protein